MALPRKLKMMNLSVDVVGYIGEVTEVTQPKMTMKLEEFRAGGMIAPVDIELGMEKLELEFKMGGYLTAIVKQFGGKISDKLFRFMGAYQQDDTEEVSSVELVMRGRITEIDNGNSKVGDDTEQSFKASLTYYKVTVDGSEVFEMDALNQVLKIDGVDKLAELRAAIGL